jgi:hypothetical protein
LGISVAALPLQRRDKGDGAGHEAEAYDERNARTTRADEVDRGPDAERPN